jgi:hypothetical protein
MKMILFCLALQYGDSLAYVNDTVILQSPECTPSLSDSVNAEYDSLSMESAEYRERATYHHKIKYRRMWGREKIFMLTYNLTRILSGHPPTIQSFRLNKAAREHSRWMAEKGWSCTHRDFNKRSKKYRFDSENVANGQYGSFGVLIAWIKSPGHRKNMYGYDQFLSGVGFYKRIEITYKKKGGKVKRIKKEKMKYYTHVFR